MSMYLCPNADFISRMLSSGFHESSTCSGSHCVLSSPMSRSKGPSSVSIKGMKALIKGTMSPALWGSLVLATVVISSTP